MLCSRPAIKDVHGLPRCVDRSSSSSSEPLSPRISCIGQVKRKNNRIVGFPNPHKSLPNNNNNNHNNIVKYSKLKKFFSSKNLTPPPLAGAGAGDCRRRRSSAAAKGGNGCSSSGSRGLCDGEKCGVNVVDLDPPLPVVRRPIKAQDEKEVVVESLWKRRSGGLALKGLQIHHHHHLQHLDQPTTV
ncbi:hypothetical protein TIFTF001_008979 [Ficus carica]|uniref:Uncharacterized protein n=1 Tax=Ficus carica TaxID=3494 RepID=A0AA88AG25_FICCA|nr:hypothetical protein TIFTF001_008979 [Ficus carica]